MVVSLNDEQYKELVLAVRDIQTALRGYNGNRGLIQSFNEHCKEADRREYELSKFKKSVYIVFGMLIGSGALGAGFIIPQIF